MRSDYLALLTKHVRDVIEADQSHLPEFLRERTHSSPGISALHQNLRRVQVVGASSLTTNN